MPDPTTASTPAAATAPDPQAPPAVWTPDRIALAVGYAASLVIVAATFTRSFAATADFAVRVGAARPGPDAWLVPIGIDVSIIAGSVMAYVSARAGARNRWAYGLFLFAAGTSVLLNIAHAPLPPALPADLTAQAADQLRAAALPTGAGELAAAKFIAALPPLLLLWITEVLLRQTTSTPAPALAPTTFGDAAAGLADSAGQAADSPATVAAVVAAYLSGGGQVADGELTAAVAEQLGVSERTARRRLEPYRTTREPAATPRALSVVTDPDTDVVEARR